MMHVSIVRGLCPNCGRLVVDVPHGSGKVFCPYCSFCCTSAQRKIPSWILGVLLVLSFNLLIMMSR